jgi:hypothetical protein
VIFEGFGMDWACPEKDHYATLATAVLKWVYTGFGARDFPWFTDLHQRKQYIVSPAKFTFQFRHPKPGG